MIFLKSNIVMSMLRHALRRAFCANRWQALSFDGLTVLYDAEDHINLSPYLSYISGALAGCAATVGSYPFDLLRTILASQGEPKVIGMSFVGLKIYCVAPPTNVSLR